MLCNAIHVDQTGSGPSKTTFIKEVGTQVQVLLGKHSELRVNLVDEDIGPGESPALVRPLAIYAPGTWTAVRATESNL